MLRPVLFVLFLAGCAAPPAPEPGSTEGLVASEATIEGTVSGPNVVVTSAGPAFVDLGVPDGARNLTIGVSASGGNAFGYAFAPSCDAIECGERFSSEDPAPLRFDAPEGGAWSVHVAKGDPGVAPVVFRLAAAALVPAGTALAAEPAEGPSRTPVGATRSRG